MSKIQNVSMIDYFNGEHINSQLAIRIADEENMFTVYDKKSNHVDLEFKFVFSDCNHNEKGFLKESEQEDILKILQFAKKNNFDVVVHCVAGVSRSAAIAQFAIDFLNFEEGNKNFEWATPYEKRPHLNKDIYNRLRLKSGFLNSWEKNDFANSHLNSYN